MIKEKRSSAKYIEQALRFGAHNYNPLEVVLARGEGIFVWDVEGKRFFDFLSAYSAVNQGHCHPLIVKALVEQASVLALTSRAFHNDRMGDMLERIAELTTFKQVLPMNTGAEAVETAIKVMRRWGYEVKGVSPDEAQIIVAKGNFHGRTTTIVGFSSDNGTRCNFGPFTPGFVSVPFGDWKALRDAMTPNTVGVLLEPIQGEAGVIIPPEGYLAHVKPLCIGTGSPNGRVLLCLDEIQTGLGRTGKMFAWQHSKVKPDIIILGKALSGGMCAVSCIACDSYIMDVFTPGSHGSTYGGNPLAAAVAMAALDVIVDQGLVENAAKLGTHALARLQEEVKSDNLLGVRGLGLMMAVEFKSAVAHDVVVALMEAGILAKDTHETTVRFCPPLVITRKQLDEALDLIIPVLNRF